MRTGQIAGETPGAGDGPQQKTDGGPVAAPTRHGEHRQECLQSGAMTAFGTQHEGVFERQDLPVGAGDATGLGQGAAGVGGRTQAAGAAREPEPGVKGEIAILTIDALQGGAICGAGAAEIALSAQGLTQYEQALSLKRDGHGALEKGKGSIRTADGAQLAGGFKARVGIWHGGIIAIRIGSGVRILIEIISQ